MTRPIFLLLFICLVISLVTTITADARQSEDIVQVRIQSSIQFDGEIPSEKLIELTETLQNVPHLQQLESDIKASRRGNSEHNRMQISGTLLFTSFEEYKTWFLYPGTDDLLERIFRNSEQFSLNLRMNNRQ